MTWFDVSGVIALFIVLCVIFVMWRQRSWRRHFEKHADFRIVSSSIEASESSGCFKRVWLIEEARYHGEVGFMGYCSPNVPKLSVSFDTYAQARDTLLNYLNEEGAVYYDHKGILLGRKKQYGRYYD